jgi:hypothetical protein
MMGAFCCRAILALMVWTAAASAQEPAPIPEADLNAAIARLMDLRDLASLVDACPADIQNSLREGLFATEWSLDDCRSDMTACVSACLGARSMTACNRVARILEMDGGTDQELGTRRYYALACALGRPGACTNRAAQIRNAPWPGDPLSRIGIAKTGDCLRRSFDQACSGDDIWGCAMAGQAWRLGEGGRPDQAIAIAQYSRACYLASTDSSAAATAACAFAEAGLALLDSRPGHEFRPAP